MQFRLLSGGAHQREYKANGEHIEYIRRAAPAELCERPVDEGHEEHRAEQAHITHRAHIKRLKHRKGLDAE